ncbi:uncharacterized protein LOC110025455 isoform X2 [Phalaenopsis equestris]|uniref:uncharacterized protein LOC110025455 isoform X2 n=1 Tax=Phalaenopsis equestris TaxID=78828 RepID=UPI0009E5163F|nr:uncharacterized protein LOC110025455 isoform X2 [Phalaenopsis equestris]
MVEAMLIQFAPSRFLRWKTSIPPNKAVKIISYTPQLNLFPPTPTFRVRIHPLSGGARAQNHGKAIDKVEEIEADVEGQLEKGEEEDFSSGHEDQDDEEDYKAVEEEFSHASAYRARRDEKDYDRDPEIADILGSCFDDPKKAQSKVEERIRRKRNKILHTKTGSATSMKVSFRKFDFSNSFIWFEFYNAPLPQDVTLLCDTIRAWYIIGRLGGCNPMNMQLSQSTMDNKRPRYDAIMGANVTPTTFYNIGDLELQDNLARFWVDIGTDEPLLLDVLVNALYCISSDLDHIGFHVLISTHICLLTAM